MGNQSISSTVDLIRVGPMPALPERRNHTTRANQTQSGLAGVSTVSNRSESGIGSQRLDRDAHRSNPEPLLSNQAASGTSVNFQRSRASTLPADIALALTYIRNRANLEGECGSTIRTHLDAIESALQIEQKPIPSSVSLPARRVEDKTSKSGSLRRSIVSAAHSLRSSFRSKATKESHPKPDPALRPLPETPGITEERMEVDRDGYEIPRTSQLAAHALQTAAYSSHTYEEIDDHTYQEIEGRGPHPSDNEPVSAVDHTYEEID